MCKEVVWCDRYEQIMKEEGCLDEETALILHLHVRGYSDVAISMHPKIFCSERTVQRRINKLKQIYDIVRVFHPEMPPREKQKIRIARLRKEKQSIIDDYVDDDFSLENELKRVIIELKDKIAEQEEVIKQLQCQLASR